MQTSVRVVPLLVKGIEHVGGMVGRALSQGKFGSEQSPYIFDSRWRVHKELRAAERVRRVLVASATPPGLRAGPSFSSIRPTIFLMKNPPAPNLRLENVVRLLHFRAEIAENALEIDLIRGIFRKHGGEQYVTGTKYN